MHHSVFDTNNICSTVFALAVNRLHSFKRQPFWLHNLNSMVPVKGMVLFIFFNHLFISIHIAFVKCIIVTDLWCHLTHNSRGLWHMDIRYMSCSSRIIKELLPKIVELKSFFSQIYNSFTNNLNLCFM